MAAFGEMFKAKMMQAIGRCLGLTDNYAKHVSGGKKGSIFSDSVVISTGSIKTGTTPITYIDGQFVKDEDVNKITE